RVNIGPVAVEASVVDEERGRAVDAAANAAREVCANALARRAGTERRFSGCEVQVDVSRVALEVDWAERLLIFEQGVVHLPELALEGGGLGEFGGASCIRVEFRKREIAEDETQAITQLRLNALDDRMGSA